MAYQGPVQFVSRLIRSVGDLYMSLQVLIRLVGPVEDLHRLQVLGRLGRTT